MDELLEKLRGSLLELDKEATLEAVRAVLQQGSDHAEAGVEAVRRTHLDQVGRRFQDGDWFLGELVYSGEIAKEAMELLSPHLSAAIERRALGTVVVGTVQGDMHDLGKNIFITYAQSAGFEIVDLGTDVTVEQFVEAAARAPAAGARHVLSADGVGRRRRSGHRGVGRRGRAGVLEGHRRWSRPHRGVRPRGGCRRLCPRCRHRHRDHPRLEPELMDFKERFLTAMNHEEPDRVPVMGLIMDPATVNEILHRRAVDFPGMLRKPFLRGAIRRL